MPCDPSKIPSSQHVRALLTRGTPLTDDLVDLVFRNVSRTTVACTKCGCDLLCLERHPLLTESVSREDVFVARGYLFLDGGRVALLELSDEEAGWDVVRHQGRRYEACPEVYVMRSSYTRLVEDEAVCDPCRLRCVRKLRRAMFAWQQRSWLSEADG